MGPDVVIPPPKAFRQWFDALPRVHRQTLAHLYRVCTTDSVEDMIRDPEHSLALFLQNLDKPDFPLRVATRLVTIRAVFDLVLVHRRNLLLLTGPFLPAQDGRAVVPLPPHQWEKIWTGWKHLRASAMSDKYLHAWIQAIQQES